MESPSSPSTCQGPGSLWDSVYQELRGLASRYLAAERRDHTLQPTALVHEAFLRLQGYRALAGCDRLEFCRAAAGAMRRILIDHARHRLRHRRRGIVVAVEAAGELGAPCSLDAAALLDLGLALAELERISERRAEIVRLRFFAGLTEEEVAGLLQLSRRTVQYEFRSARAWLRCVLGSRGETDGVEAAAKP